MENTNKQLTLVRTFDAPRALVWKAWTDPKMLAVWWGPNGFTAPVCELDLTPGGAIRIDMEWPKGGKIDTMRGIVKEVKEPERLIFTSTAIEDEKGEPGLENLNTVTFEEDGEKTKVTVHVEVLRAEPRVAQAIAGMEIGWNQTLDKMGAFVVSK